MIHYHGTPIGGALTEAARFLLGRHALVPFSYPRDLELVMETCKSFVIDNGAFTVWKQGGKLDVDGYVRWLRTSTSTGCPPYLHPGFDWALIPDVIGGTAEENDAMLADWPKDIAGVPVYHLHEPLERAERLANEWPVVAIGSSGEWPTPGVPKWWTRMQDVLDVMCDEQGVPKCKLHGLRMMDPAIFTRIPFRSVDSTNAAQNGARNGRVIDEKLSSGQGAIITAMRVEAHNSPSRWDRDSSLLVRTSPQQQFAW